MSKLNQINALVAGKKGEIEKAKSELYKIVQKKDVFDGLQRTYKPLDDQSTEKLPSEAKKVQYKAKTLLAYFADRCTELLDLVATQDHGNQLAKADIIIDGVTLLPGVPVTTLLFLEKQVNDWITYVSHFHVPEPGEEWEYDAQSDLLKTPPSQTVRTKKVPKAFVKYPATEQHPAQVETFMEDIVAGTWTLVSYTGRIPAKDKNDTLVRLNKLRDAVKTAREQANNIDVHKQRLGEILFTYAFGLAK